MAVHESLGCPLSKRICFLEAPSPTLTQMTPLQEDIGLLYRCHLRPAALECHVSRVSRVEEVLVGTLEKMHSENYLANSFQQTRKLRLAKVTCPQRQKLYKVPDMCYSLPVPLCWDAASHPFKHGCHYPSSPLTVRVTFLAKPKTERSLYPSTKPPSCLSLRLPAARAKDRIEGSILNQWQQSRLAQCRKGARSGRRPWQSLRLMLLPSWPILSSVTSRLSCWPSSS